MPLPEAVRVVEGRHAWFTVRDKKFVYFLEDHHGDGIVSVCVRTHPGQSDALLATEPERFYKPAYMWHRGWIGLRLDVGEIDWDEVAEFVTESYRMTAPKRLLERMIE
jgi:hypothetical protein